MDVSNLTPTTELEAVNRIIGSVGESPVSTLSDNGVLDATNARAVLTNVSRDVQTRGWDWNREDDYPLNPSFPDGEVAVPSNILSVKRAGASEDLDLVWRGARLYNRTDRTYKIDQKVTADLIFFLPFEELPENARRYITLSAVRQFQEHFYSSEMLSEFHSRDEAAAWNALISDELEESDHNYLYDSDDVLNIHLRGGSGAPI